MAEGNRADAEGAGRSSSLVAQPAAPNPSATGLDRPFALARTLAAFLTSDNVAQVIGTFANLPEDTRAAIEQRLGRALELRPDPRTDQPVLHRIEEREVLDFLRGVAGAIPAGLDNLTGFEWVEVDRLLAGHYVTDPLTVVAEMLPVDPTPLQLAQFCILSAWDFVPGSVALMQPPEPGVVAEIALNAIPTNIMSSGPRILVQYDLRPLIEPIRVLLVGGRAIALTGLERLAMLAERGIRRALCSISYGYGADALEHWPSVPHSVLRGTRPPMVRDFVDPDLAISIPVRRPTTLIRFRPDRIRLEFA